MAAHSDVLVATLGAEPQVVTITLDLLHAQGCRIEQTIVLHTAPESTSISKALAVLEANRSRLPGYETVAFDDNIHDVLTRQDALAVLRTLYREISALKDAGRRVHLCAAGGRKAMSMYGMVVAQLLFDEHDRLYVLLSNESLRLERRLHATPDEASLLRIPVIRYRVDLLSMRQFVRSSLSRAEQQVLELLAREGLGDQQIARERSVVVKTVETQLSSIRKKAYDSLGLQFTDRQMVIAEFAPYFLLEDAIGDLIEFQGNP